MGISIGEMINNAGKNLWGKKEALQKHKRAIRIFWYVLVPLLLFLSLIPSPFEHYPLSVPKEGQVTTTENVNSQPAKNILQELFRFTNLEWNRVYFVDNGGKIVKNGIETPLYFNWAVHFNNQTTLEIPFNGSNSTTVKAGTSFAYQWEGRPEITITYEDVKSESTSTLVPNTESYWTIDITSFIVMLWVFFLAWYESTKLTLNFIVFVFGTKGDNIKKGN